MSQSPQSPAPTSALAIVALVCVFVCWPVGLILSIVALVRISGSNGALGGKTIAIVALCLNVLIVPMVGVMAAIAIPNFVKFQCRSKQSEARGNLKALYVAEEAYRAAQDKYSADLGALQFQPRGAKIRYQYSVLSTTAASFVAEARGVGEMTGDLWRIDEHNNLVNVESKCR
jgi:type IV pilus assembly protein PilA